MVSLIDPNQAANYAVSELFPSGWEMGYTNWDLNTGNIGTVLDIYPERDEECNTPVLGLWLEGSNHRLAIVPFHTGYLIVHINQGDVSGLIGGCENLDDALTAALEWQEFVRMAKGG